jgi:hypothetical protein
VACANISKGKRQRSTSIWETRLIRFNRRGERDVPTYNRCACSLDLADDSPTIKRACGGKNGLRARPGESPAPRIALASEGYRTTIVECRRSQTLATRRWTTGQIHNRKGSDGLGGLHDLQLCFARVVRLNTVIRNPLPDVKATRVRVVTHGFPVFSLNLREHLLLETRSAFHIGDWQSSFRGSSPFRNRLTPSSSAQSASHSPRT